METPANPATPPTPDTAAPTDADRREALRKLGVMAALTPPSVMTLLMSRRASADSGPPVDP
jgi:hypothetical protein